MSTYIPDESLIVFDVTPPLQYVGAKAYRKAYEDFYAAAFPGPVEVEMSNLSVTTDGTLGFSHEIDTWSVTDKEGKRVTFTVRETYVYRKINGKWLSVHEHASVPADVVTGKAELSLKPSL